VVVGFAEDRVGDGAGSRHFEKSESRLRIQGILNVSCSSNGYSEEDDLADVQTMSHVWHHRLCVCCSCRSHPVVQAVLPLALRRLYIMCSGRDSLGEFYGIPS